MDLKSFKIKTSQGKKLNFKISNNNLILDGDDTYDQLSITSNNQDYVEPSLASMKGIIATRQWTYQTIAYLFEREKTDQFNAFIKEAIDKIKDDAMEKTIVKAFAKHMCERYFKSFGWADGVCKPDIECNDDELLTIKEDSSMRNSQICLINSTRLEVC